MNIKFMKFWLIYINMIILPLFAISQTNSLVSVTRVFPKIDKTMEFEKALATHAQKYHKGLERWSVFEIVTGPDAGGYHITEGPKSWTSEDKRGNISDEHDMDWNKNVAIYLTDRYSSSYFEYNDSLSTSLMTESTDKIQITRVYPKMAAGSKITRILKNLKPAWKADGSSVAVYESNASGRAQFAIVRRFKQGLKENEEGFSKPFKQTFEKIHGAGSFDFHLDDIIQYTDEVWSELLFYRANLSSK